MAVREIYRMGNPELLKVSAAVDDPTAPEIKDLIDDMRDTLEKVNGTGLAAPQIGIPKRIVLYHLPASRIPDGAKTRPIPWTPLVNPELTPLADEKRDIWERCLSLPGLYGKVPRYNSIHLAFSTLSGERVELEHRGFLAMLLQHECDHLDGVLYPQRMSDIKNLAYSSEVAGENSFYGYSAAEFDGD